VNCAESPDTQTIKRAPAPRSSRKRAWAQAFLLLAVVAAFYWPCAAGRSLPTGGDMANLFLPTWIFVDASVRDDGVWPLWNPWIFSGHPAAAAAQSAVFYPPARLFPFASAPVLAVNWFILAHLLWAGLGAWGFARSRSGLGLRGAGPWIAGLIFPCSAWFWGQIEHLAALAAASWTPWITWAAGCLADNADNTESFCCNRAGKAKLTTWTQGGAARIAIFALALAMQILAGHPQKVFIGLIAALAWLLWRAAASGRKYGLGAEKSLRSPAHNSQLTTHNSQLTTHNSLLAPIARALGRFAAAGALAALLAAVQLFPTFELSVLSYRSFDTSAYASQFSMPPRLLAMLLYPDVFGSYRQGWSAALAWGEYGIYIGIPALALAAFGAWIGLSRRRPKPGKTQGWQFGMARRRFGAPVWIALAVAGILLALGGNADPRRIFNFVSMDEFPPGPGASLLGALTALAPPARHFRVPGRFLMLWSLAAAFLAAGGWRWVEIHTRRCPALSRAAAPVCAMIVFFFLFVPSFSSRLAFRSDYKSAFRVLHDPQGWAAYGQDEQDFQNDKKNIKGESPSEVRECTLDGRIYRLTTADDELYAGDSSAPGVGDALTVDERVALRAERLMPNLNLLAHAPLADGYEEGLLPTIRYKDFLLAFNASIRRPDPDARLLALGGVRWIWSDLPVASPDWEPVESFGRAGGASAEKTTRASAEPRDPKRAGAAGRLPGRLYQNRLWRGAAFEESEFPGIDWGALDGPFQRALAKAGADPDPRASGAKTSAAAKDGNLRMAAAREVAARCERSRQVRNYLIKPADSPENPSAPNPNNVDEESGIASADLPRPRWTTRIENANTILCQKTGALPNPPITDQPSTSPAEDSPARLILAQTSYPGWKARAMNGNLKAVTQDSARFPNAKSSSHALDLEILNAWNSAATLRGGETAVRFSYEPWSFRLGAFASALGIAVVAGFFSFSFRPRLLRRRPGTVQGDTRRKVSLEQDAQVTGELGRDVRATGLANCRCRWLGRPAQDFSHPQPPMSL